MARVRKWTPTRRASAARIPIQAEAGSQTWAAGEGVPGAAMVGGRRVTLGRKVWRWHWPGLEDQPGEGEPDHRQMVVEADPGTPLIVVETDLLFGILVRVALDDRSAVRDLGQLIEAHRGRAADHVLLEVLLWGGSLQEQPEFLACGHAAVGVQMGAEGDELTREWQAVHARAVPQRAPERGGHDLVQLTRRVQVRPRLPAHTRPTMASIRGVGSAGIHGSAGSRSRALTRRAR